MIKIEHVEVVGWEHVIRGMRNPKNSWENDVMTGLDANSTPVDILDTVIDALNVYRDKFLETKDKKYWWQMIQLLPTSYNQKRTVMLNYEVLTNIYHSRKNHKLDEWHVFCEMIEGLPYSEIIVGEKGEENGDKV